MANGDDFDTDMQTIRDYVHAVVEAETKVVIAYTSALANVETTLQSASPSEATPDILGAVLKSGLKALEKEAVTAVKSATGADLGPVADMIHALWEEVERAERASQSLAAGEWIKTLRTEITNAYTQGRSGDDLREQIETEYKDGDEGERGGYIAGVQNELWAMRTVKAPRAECVELAMYEAWINQFFDGDCMDGTGSVLLQFSEDGSPESAKVNAVLGERVAGALNVIMAGAGVHDVMGLGVVKKVCRGDACMCFEPDNTVRKTTEDDDAERFLSDQATWRNFARFSA